MANYKNMIEIKAANRAYAAKNDRAYWFDKGAMDFFASKLYDKVYHGCMFISSEQFLATEYSKLYLNGSDGERRFTIRVCKESGSIDTVGEFQQYATNDEAEAAVKHLVAE